MLSLCLEELRVSGGEWYAPEWWWEVGALPSLMHEDRACLPPEGSQASSLPLLPIHLLLPTRSLFLNVYLRRAPISR